MATPSFSPRQPLTAQEKSYYDSIFKELDPESLGIVTGESARSTFEKSGLPPAILGEIWQIADPTNLGFLTENAFMIALRIIGHVQNGAKPDKSLIDLAAPLARFQTIHAIQEPTSGTAGISSPRLQQQPTVTQPTTLPPLTNSDISKFGQLFSKNAAAGIINGEQARQIFLKAKLPTTTLSQIWALVDLNNIGQLTREEFVLAMFLIQGSLNGSIKQLPPIIPQSYWDQVRNAAVVPAVSSSVPSSAPSFSPQLTGSRPNISRVPSSFANASNDWVISPQKRAQFDSIFEGLDKSSKGVLGPNEVAPFLMTSKLPQDVLANIWDLADIHNTGEFTKQEFSIAMFLVQKKIAGTELPSVIPDSMLSSSGSTSPQANFIQPQHTQTFQQPQVQQTQTFQPSHQQPAPAPVPKEPKSQSAIADLVDLNDAFSTPSPSTASDKDQPRNFSASSVSYTPTGSTIKPFVPSSSFGQDLFKKEDVKEKPTIPVAAPVAAPAVSSNQGSNSPFASAASARTAEAKQDPVASASRAAQSPSVPSFAPQATYNRGINVISSNNDLLADSNPEISGKLSQATTEMANLSTQIGSLTTQTSQLHDKRTRAEKELTKITTLRNDIQSKLSNLRVAYDQEVKQTQQVESLLASSKSETEDLRKQTSLAEAQYNTAQSNLQQLQAQLEESQKENAALKERIGTLNAEQIEASKQLEKVQNDLRQSKGFAAINAKQAGVSEAKLSSVKDEIENLLNSFKELETHQENYSKKQLELENLRSTIETQEQELTKRKQLHEQNSGLFVSKETELSSRLAEQQEREAAIQQHDQHLQQLIANLQERKKQLDEAEAQLQQQQVDYAHRIQSFTNKQIDGASNTYVGYDSDKDRAEADSKIAAGSKDISTKSEVAAPSGTTNVAETSAKDTTGILAGVVVGAATVAATSHATSNAATESERDNTVFSSPVTNTEQGTSVASDDYQYDPNRVVNQFSLPIERPESTTSSVQNNAPQSVRGDEIDVNSDGAASIHERTASVQDVLHEGYKASDSRGGESSSGVGSFELVDSNKSESDLTLKAPASLQNENANSIEGSLPGAWQGSSNPEVATASDSVISVPPATPLSATNASSGTSAVNLPSPTVASSSEKDAILPQTQNNKSADEFPPIKELSIDESDSEDEFHEALDQTPVSQAPKQPPKRTDSDFSFEGPSSSSGPFAATASNFQPHGDLSGEVPNSGAKDAFPDDFEGLEAAEEVGYNDDVDEDIDQAQDFNDELEDGNFYGADEFNEGDQGAGEDNEEWEQIFAGFGNAGQAPAVPQHPQHAPTPPQPRSAHPYAQQSHGSGSPVNSPAQQFAQPQPVHSSQQANTAEPVHRKIATTPRSLAVQELTGMGFTREEALAALTREKWNLEAATNYLLDNA